MIKSYQSIANKKGWTGNRRTNLISEGFFMLSPAEMPKWSFTGNKYRKYVEDVVKRLENKPEQVIYYLNRILDYGNPEIFIFVK